MNLKLYLKFMPLDEPEWFVFFCRNFNNFWEKRRLSAYRRVGGTLL